ncbi:MAG: hypothetical protein CL920_11080 [Deltaproteobacteria bacterium]|nr:hypothetical protein [Deltaproteobacteria bacterium]
MRWMSWSLLLWLGVMSHPVNASTPGKKPESKPAQRAAVRREVPAPRSAPAAREVKKPAKAQNAVKKSAGKKAAKKPAKRRATVKKPKKTILSSLPRRADKDVFVKTLSNGMLLWCMRQADWKFVELRILVAGGAASDPPKLHGRARFLSALLERTLNAPENPAKSPLPVGGAFYKVSLQKDWLVLKGRFAPNKLDLVLAHFAKALETLPPSTIPNKLRKSLAESTRKYPPPGVDERIDAQLFTGSRAALLRGDAHTFNRLKSFALQTAHKEMFRAQGMRVLVSGGVDCAAFAGQAQKTLGSLPKHAPPKRIKHGGRKFSPFSAMQRQRWFAQNQVLLLYKLPSLSRLDVLPLRLLHYVTEKELQRTLTQKFGYPVPIRSRLRFSQKAGYMLFVLPATRANRKAIQEIAQRAVGQLLMDPYPPLLEGRLALYRETFAETLLQQKESSLGVIEQLLPQQMLSAKEPFPFQSEPVLKTLATSSFRKIARHYLSNNSSALETEFPFTFRRLSLVLIGLLMLWFFLDLLIRRTRRYDE